MHICQLLIVQRFACNVKLALSLLKKRRRSASTAQAGLFRILTTLVVPLTPLPNSISCGTHTVARMVTCMHQTHCCPQNRHPPVGNALCDRRDDHMANANGRRACREGKCSRKCCSPFKSKTKHASSVARWSQKSRSSSCAGCQTSGTRRRPCCIGRKQAHARQTTGNQLHASGRAG